MYNVVNKKVAFIVKALNEKRNKVEIPFESNYAKLILETVESPNPDAKGFDVKIIRKINRIQEIYEKNKENKSFKLEDADFEFVKEKLKTMSWAFAEMCFVEFTDYINELKPEKK